MVQNFCDSTKELAMTFVKTIATCSIRNRSKRNTELTVSRNTAQTLNGENRKPILPPAALPPAFACRLRGSVRVSVRLQAFSPAVDEKKQ